MLAREDLIELSHISTENVDKFGATVAQCQYLVDLVYRCDIPIQCYVIDKLYAKSGNQNIKYHLTSIEMTKLINALEAKIEFQFVEWNSDEWHEFKLQEKQKGLKAKPYIQFDYNYDNPTEEKS
jgi:hypothetical protein